MFCPRCNGSTLRYDSPRPDGTPVWIDRCRSAKPCGVWYDGDALDALHARFEDASVRDALLGARRVEGERIACPRCEGATLAVVDFGGVELDVCERCRGLWVDCAEYGALMNAMRLREPGEARSEVSHYRAAAVSARMERKAGRWARCVRCGAESPAEDVVFTERGLACMPCGLAVRGEDAGAGPTTVDLDGWFRDRLASLNRAVGSLLGRRGGAELK